MQGLLPRPGRSWGFWISRSSCMICCAVWFSGGAGAPASPCVVSTLSARLTSLRSLEKGERGVRVLHAKAVLPFVPAQAKGSYTHHSAAQQLQIPGSPWALGWAYQQGSERRPGICSANHCARSQASTLAPVTLAALPEGKSTQ